jgi:hypothetical protein
VETEEAKTSSSSALNLIIPIGKERVRGDRAKPSMQLGCTVEVIETGHII